MIGNGVTKEILVRRLLSRLLLVPNHHANVSACHRKRGQEKRKTNFMRPQCRGRAVFGNAKSAVGDQQRFIPALNQILT